MSWEWRYFMPSERMVAPGAREDVYYPAGPALGLKLRNGQGMLEAKTRGATHAIAGRGEAEEWEKRLHSGCVTHSGNLRPDSAFYAQSSAPPALRVFCRKSREHTDTGEKTDCLFWVCTADCDTPMLLERWHSVSVEMFDVSMLEAAVKATPLPEDALVTGYPGMVEEIARRALTQQVTPAGTSLEILGPGEAEECVRRLAPKQVSSPAKQHKRGRPTAAQLRLFRYPDSIWEHPITHAKVYVGSMDASKNRDILTRHGIRHIVNCTTNLTNVFEGEAEYSYLRFDAIDVFRISEGDEAEPVFRDTSEGALAFFAPAFDFIDAATDAGHSVLVHCVAGAHRAGTTGVAYYMHRKQPMKAEDAILHCNTCREWIDPAIDDRLMWALGLLERAHAPGPAGHTVAVAKPDGSGIDLNEAGMALLEASKKTKLGPEPESRPV